MANNIGNISRRNFFKLALGGAVVAATVSPAIAAVLTETYSDKLKTLIRLHSKVIEIHLQGVDNIEVRKANKKDFDATFNELIGYICDNFAAPEKGSAAYETALADTKLVFNWKRMEVECPDWKANPPVICAAAVGISVIRDLLSVHRCKLDPSVMSNFDRFADEFQDLILAA